MNIFKRMSRTLAEAGPTLTSRAHTLPVLSTQSAPLTKVISIYEHVKVTRVLALELGQPSLSTVTSSASMGLVWFGLVWWAFPST